MDGGEFAADLRRRVFEARQALAEATADDDLYAVDVRLGELDSMLRLAMEHGIELGDDADRVVER